MPTGIVHRSLGSNRIGATKQKDSAIYKVMS